MTEHPQLRSRGQARVWVALSVVTFLLALLIVPPFISVTRYKSRITQVISASVGRPVRLSSVQLRILPRPSFVITDLTIEDDPTYGAEPVLHANSVTASIRLLPLWWRTRLEISRISVDEASLNLVHSGDRWNFDSLFRTAATRAQSGPATGRRMPLPYLEATDSRVNIKDGVEKLPYSLLNADLSLWQESPGDWRVRLKGQPARTDVSLDLADTGIVRLEGRMRQSPGLRHMPVHLDLEWREAQLGQLTRLVLGSDQGWRGDLTGELHVDGTTETAQVTTRLRATGVHRAEFAPASPIDFDASCSFVTHYSDRGLEKLLCESPVGNGRARLTGELPAHSAQPRLTVELDRVPAQLALDMLRTVRNGIDPTLQAEGAISGRMSYAPPEEPAPVHSTHALKPGRIHAPPLGPLSGSITIAALRITGDNLSRAIFLPKVAVEPAPDQPTALIAVLPITAGAPSPLNVTARIMLNGYRVETRGSAALPRLREFTQVLGLPDASMLDRIEGQPAVLDLTADGPWLQPPSPPAPDRGNATTATNLAPTPVLIDGTSDHLIGTVTLHSASWRPAFLAGPVEISNAVLHVNESNAKWDPVAFSYGPVRGSATLGIPANCAAPEKCPPGFTIDFGSLDAATLQAAILGARKPGTLISSLLSRLRPGSAPAWPQLEGIVRANAFVLGPVTLTNAESVLAVKADATEIRSLDAGLLGGHIHATGSVATGDKPTYTFKGEFDQVNAAKLGLLLGMNWSGNAIEGTGAVELAGFTDRDLADSAKGSLHFDWKRGAIASTDETDIPPALTRFDLWSADAEISNGAVTLKRNQVQHRQLKQSVEGSASFGDPPTVTFGQSLDAHAANGRAKP